MSEGELVKALRCCTSSSPDDCDICAYQPFCQRNGTGRERIMIDAAAAIEELQAETERLKAQLPKRGEWINSKERMRPDMCSVCGCIYEADRFMDKIAWNYCPNCGSLMVGENDERN